MKCEIKHQKSIITFLSEACNFIKLKNWIYQSKIATQVILDNILVVDIDSNYEELILEIQSRKKEIKAIICISSTWDIQKYTFANNIGCRAFLNYKNLTSLTNVLELIQHENYVFDDTVTSLFKGSNQNSMGK